MIDAVQSVLLIVIVLLTVLLCVLGVQVFFILKELRSTINRANRVLENTESITNSISQPMSFLSTFALGAKSISKFLNMASKKEEK